MSSPGARPKRINRWDRPKPPKDWRYWVGGLGRVLITIGLLMFAFVAYQLWGTGIQTAQAQDRLERQFEELVGATPPVAVSTTTTTAPSNPLGTAPLGTTPLGTTPTATGATGTGPTAATGLSTTPTDTVPEGTVSTPGTDVASVTGPPLGYPIARIQIPKISLDWYVVEGVGRQELKNGVGHFPETPMPGQLGNSGIAGHRTTYGAAFGDLDVMAPGDAIDVTTANGLFHYRVTGMMIVAPNEYDKLFPIDDGTVARLTLVTCHPEYTTRQRLAVTAELIVETSPQAVTPPPTIPRPPTTELPTEPLDSTPASGSTSAGVPTDTPTSTPTPTGALGESADVFAEGWFSDPAAYSHVIGWGLALVIWVVICWLIARRFRRLWLGVLLGIVPFVVMLYFWFENVNRMLPPNL